MERDGITNVRAAVDLESGEDAEVAATGGPHRIIIHDCVVDVPSGWSRIADVAEQNLHFRTEDGARECFVDFVEDEESVLPMTELAEGMKKIQAGMVENTDEQRVSVMLSLVDVVGEAVHSIFNRYEPQQHRAKFTKFVTRPGIAVRMRITDHECENYEASEADLRPILDAFAAQG